MCNEQLDNLLIATWPVVDRFVCALWVGALTSAAHKHAAYLDDDFAELATRCLERWPARARA